MNNNQQELIKSNERIIRLMYSEILELKNALRQTDIKALAAIEERYGDQCYETRKFL